MGDFMKKARDIASKNEQRIDQGIRKAGEQINRRTGGKYEEKVDKAVAQAQRATDQRRSGQ